MLQHTLHDESGAAQSPLVVPGRRFAGVLADARKVQAAQAAQQEADFSRSRQLKAAITYY